MIRGIFVPLICMVVINRFSYICQVGNCQIIISFNRSSCAIFRSAPLKILFGILTRKSLSADLESFPASRRLYYGQCALQQIVQTDVQTNLERNTAGAKAPAPT